MNLWRIAVETRNYSAHDLSGAGAARNPGRWNADGEPVIYCAPSIAMAVLETVAHIDVHGLPLSRFVVQIAVPDEVWHRREEMLEPKDLPTAWHAIPAGRSSVEIGSRWLDSLRSAILLVPSVIVVEEPIALINPKHPDSNRIRATVRRRFEYGSVKR